MSAPTLHSLKLRLSWALARHRRSLARSALAPKAALLTGFVLLCAATAWLQTAHQRQQMAENAAARQAVAAPTHVPVADPVAAGLGAFHAILPAHRDAVQVLRELIERADAEGLMLVQGNYQAVDDPSGEFTKLRILHPVSGDARDVHRYIIDSLRMHRALALESVRFKRPDGHAAQVEAHIQWLLFTRRLDSPASPGLVQ